MRRAAAGNDETGRVRALYQREAPKYDGQMSLVEKVLFGGGREWVCSQASGSTLELALGTGRNLPFYPPHVQLTGVELSEAMLAIARQLQATLGRQADLRIGDAQQLEFPDQCFDTVICTLGLCTIPDDGAAVAEAWRVLRPGGRFLLLEHVRSPQRGIRRGQRLLEPLTVRFGGDHLTREPLDHITAQGFVIERMERSKLGIVARIAARKLDGRQA